MNVLKKIGGFIGGVIPMVSGFYGNLILKLSGLAVALVAKLTGVMVNSDFFCKIGSFLKSIFGTLKKYIFKQSVVKILSYLLYAAAVVLTVVQAGFMIKNVVTAKDDYINAFIAGNAEVITSSAIAAVCVVFVFVQCVCSVVSFFKNGYKIKVGFIIAFIGMYAVSLYAKACFAEALAILPIWELKFFKPTMIVWAFFAVIRLMRKDCLKRLMLFVFAAVGLIVVIAAFGGGFGTIGKYSILGEISFSASSLDPIAFIRCAASYFRGETIVESGYESMIFISSVHTDKGWAISSAGVAVALNFGIIFLCGTMPFLLLSLAAGFCGMMTAEETEQYVLLRKIIAAVRFVLVSAIVLSVIAAVCAAQFGRLGETISFSTDGGKVAVMFIVSVLLLILTDLPWRISVSDSFKKSVKEAF